jgi:putative tryptophan/tyrosine transport system substrate-binding protein
MRRRDFITLLSGAMAAWPLAARAQQPATPVVGFMSARSPAESARVVAAFHKGLNEAGYFEGRNVEIEYRWAEGKYDLLPQMAADLVRRQVNVIVAIGDPSPHMAKAQTQTIPIVFAANGDPVREGLVATLNRPGGNVTGITIFGAAAVTKRLQLLHELVRPAAITYLMNPSNPNGDTEMDAAQIAARSIGQEMIVLGASSERELDTAFATTAQQRGGALLVASDLFFLARREVIVSLAARHQLPAIYYLREFAEAGGLMTYGNILADVYHQVGVYVGRILKGAKPTDLPVMQSTKFEFVLNLKTAKRLGLEIPPALLAVADEVIEL